MGRQGGKLGNGGDLTHIRLVLVKEGGVATNEVISAYPY